MKDEMRAFGAHEWV